jgi:hypothetical protein
MRVPRLLVAVSTLLGCTPALAQTCATPIQVGTQMMPYVAGYDSCTSFDNISYYGGVVYAPGRDVVYRVYGYRMRYGATPALRFVLQPDPAYDAALFACGQCGMTPTCFDMADGHGPGWSESMIEASQHAAYYVMVDSLTAWSPYGDCGGYSLLVDRY